MRVRTKVAQRLARPMTMDATSGPPSAATGRTTKDAATERRIRRYAGRWGPIAALAGGALLVPILFLVPAASATFVMNPLFNQGCNGNPHGTYQTFPPIGSTNQRLTAPSLYGTFLKPNVAGLQNATSRGATSSAVQNGEYMMVGPNNPNGSATCYVPGAKKVVSATFVWQANWTSSLYANCTGGASAAASYDMYVVGNFHIANAPWYLITPVSPATTVGAFAIGCGGPYLPGLQSGTFTVTTPLVTVYAGTSYDFYSAIWAYNQIQLNIPHNATASAFSASTWSASLLSVTCNGC